MVEDLSYYIIAVKRNFRNLMQENWLDIISSISDVEVVNSNEFRAKIRATPSGVTQIRQRFKNELIVEDIIDREII